jgi:SAM-dependent methyltransferase
MAFLGAVASCSVWSDLRLPCTCVLRDERIRVAASTARGAKIYTKPILAIYDIGVLGFSNSYIWGCPSRRILGLYNRYASARHLEIGVGTGYFLDRCAFPTRYPAITVLDLNRNSLEVAARRIRRYRPATCHSDVLQPIPLPAHGYDSIGCNYVLHCLPGPFSAKARVFANLTPLLAPGGVVFGTTILGKSTRQRILARELMDFYNRLGVFSNADDNCDDLATALQQHFRTAAIRVEGSVASFVGTM